MGLVRPPKTSSPSWRFLVAISLVVAAVLLFEMRSQSREGEWVKSALTRRTKLFNDRPTIAEWHKPSPLPGHPLVQYGDCRPFCDREKLRGLIPQFIEVYKNRPHKNNVCGCQISHAFIAFAVAKLLNPKVVIENGVNGGMTTYLMRSALPEAHIYSIDPAPNPICIKKYNKFLPQNTERLERWKNPHDATYYTGPDFKDFHDINWDDKGIDKENTLVFFDTHISDYHNTLKAAKAGFKWLLYDDNYPGQDNGDMDGTSVKQVFSKNDGRSYRLYQTIDMYYELPPLVLPVSLKIEKLVKEAPLLEVHEKHIENSIDLLDPVTSFTEPLLDLENPEDQQIFRELNSLTGTMPEFLQTWNHMAISRLRNI